MEFNQSFERGKEKVTHWTQKNLYSIIVMDTPGIEPGTARRSAVQNEDAKRA